MWYKQSVSDRKQLMNHYKTAYPGFSYKDMVNHFNDTQQYADGGEHDIETPKMLLTSDPELFKKRTDERNDSIMLAQQSGLNIKALKGYGYKPESINNSTWKVGNTETRSSQLNNGPIVDQSTVAGINPTQSLFMRDREHNAGYNVAMYKYPTQDVGFIKPSPSNPPQRGKQGLYRSISTLPNTAQVKQETVPPQVLVPEIQKDPINNKGVIQVNRGPSKYQSNGYFFADGKQVSQDLYDNYYKNYQEVNRTTGLPIHQYGGVQRFDEGGFK